ncbi:MAG TPA: anti-phage dCTP deaminase [Chitinophagaceae bacterium]|nr:anti-phage dCTP deaminase [Chitinophagaceae bacterium]
MKSAEARSYIPEMTDSQNVNQSSREKIKKTLTDELIIGICTPIGSSNQEVISEIEKILKEQYKYKVKRLKLSAYIGKYATTKTEKNVGETTHFTTLMNKIIGGDELREKYSNSVLAELAINDIHLSRHEDDEGTLEFKETEELKSRRVCFIVDSIKHKEELDLLREVYKDIFYFFSIFSPISERKANLNKKGLSPSEIEKIIETDNFENSKHGQNVKDTFVEGDFFVRVSNENLSALNSKIDRYLTIIFESGIVTPHPNEIAMYEAKSAAGNSACLSRQVGAAITNNRGEIISRGWNDVPKFGGNLYKEGDIEDNRCKFAGYCSNDRTKDILADNILTNILSDPKVDQQVGLKKLLKADVELRNLIVSIIRKSSKVKDLIEFSRSVHAEMHAIIIGSQLAGSKMIGGKLFCTTYPCHNCARHIIVAGIKEIFYIEPYSKSLCLALHNDAMTEDETEDNKVKLLMYDGVAPRRYMDFFIMRRSRKDSDGKINLEFKDHFNPKTRLSLQAVPTLEQQATHSLYEAGLLK